MENTVLLLLAFCVVLLVILIASFNSRAKVFSQYLKAMTGIKLKPGEIRQVYRLKGRPGVRELFLDLIIREDLKNPVPITPDTPPEKPVTELIDK